MHPEGVPPIRTVADLIALWPSAEVFSDDIGLKYRGHGRMMRLRGRISERWWDAIVIAGSKRDLVGVNHKLLARINGKAASPQSAEAA